MNYPNTSFAPIGNKEEWIEEPSYYAAPISYKHAPRRLSAHENERSKLRTGELFEQNDELPMLSASTMHSTGDSFVSSLRSRSSNSMHSSSGLGTISNDPFTSSGKSQQRHTFETDPNLPHINHTESGTENDPMGRSLRLLKTPHSRHRTSDYEETESSVTSNGYAYSHTYAHASDTLEETTYINGDDRYQNRHSAPAHGRPRAAGNNDINRQLSESYENGHPPHTQPNGFDSASKSRLRRTRLKSADAAVVLTKNDFHLSLDSIDGEGEGSSQPRSLQPSQHYTPKPPVGRTLASQSHNGLDALVSHDERPVGGGSSGARGGVMHTFSCDQEYPDQQEYEPCEPSPARRLPSTGRRIRAHSDAPSASSVQPSPLKLAEVTSLIDKPDTTFDYIPSDQMEPCRAPAQDLSAATKGLETQEWPEIFHTLNTLRKLAIHHANLLVSSGNLHNLILLMMKRVDALRSSLAKNALLTVEDLFNGLKKNLDAEVAVIIPGVLKRAIDSSSFIVESADSVLQTIIEQSSLARSLGSILLHVTHRSAVLRAKVAMCLYALVIAKGDELPHCKEFDSFKNSLSKLLQDAAPDTRAYSRETVRLLLQRYIATRGELETAVGADLLDKILRENSTAHVLSPTVRGSTVLRSVSTADHGISSSSPARPSRTGRNTPHRDSPVTGPFTPTRERTNTDWTKSEDSGNSTPTPGKNRAQRSTQLHLQNPSNRIRSGMHRRDAEESHLEEQRLQQLQLDHNHAQHLALSAEHLSAQIDSQLSSPVRPGKAGGIAAGAKGPSAPITGQAHSSSHAHSHHGQSHSAGSALAAAAKRTMEHDPELSCWQEILTNSASSSWTDRKIAISRITDMLVQHYDVLKDANKLGPCVDALLARLDDGSAKVQMHTLESLERICEEEPLVLQHNLLQIVVPAVLGSAASSNKLISGKSIVMLRLLFDTLTPLQVAQYLCQTALHEKDKLRLTALRFLADVMPVFCCDHDTVTSIAKKILFPMLCKLLFTPSTKGDMRVSGVECVRALQQCLPAQKVWLWADDPHQQEEFKRITCTA